MSPELLIVAALAVYRITFMLNAEAGPKDIFGRLRTRMGVRFDEFSQPYSDGWIGQAVLCFYCLSIWVSFAMTLFIALATALNRTDLAFWFLCPFALSGAAILPRTHDKTS